MIRSLALVALLSPAVPLALGALSGCGPHATEPPATEAAAATGLPGSDDDDVRRDVRGTIASIAAVARRIEALDADQKARAAASLRILSVNDPYTRSALQLPFALQRVVHGIDASRLDPLVRRDWETLQEGLTTHVGVLEALGVDLSLPAPGDGLYGAPPSALVDRATLIAAADPLLAIAPLIDAMTDLARRIEPPTQALLDLHSDRVEALTGVIRPCPRGPWAVLPGQPWTLGMQLGGWHDALRRVEPFARDAEARAAIVAMNSLLDAQSEASLATPRGQDDRIRNSP